MTPRLHTSHPFRLRAAESSPQGPIGFSRRTSNSHG
jgi:hypothetical protein